MLKFLFMAIVRVTDIHLDLSIIHLLIKYIIIKSSICGQSRVYLACSLYLKIWQSGYLICLETSRDVPDPETSIRNPVKFRYPALSGIL